MRDRKERMRRRRRKKKAVSIYFYYTRTGWNPAATATRRLPFRISYKNLFFLSFFYFFLAFIILFGYYFRL